MTRDLASVFQAYANGTGMDARSFAKSIRDAGLLDSKFKTIDASLAFTGVARSVRKIDFDGFKTALLEVEKKRAMTRAQVEDAFCKIDICSTEEKQEKPGPARFFYDVKTYTGIHRNGGPDPLGPCETLQSMLNRDRTHERAASADRRQKSKLRTSPTGTMMEAEEEGQITSCPSQASSSFSGSVCRGPERFFYDISSYTGIHRNGGPDCLGPGETFQDMVNRNREQERAASAPRRCRRGSPEPSTFTSQLEDLEKPFSAAVHRRRSSSPLGPERFYYDRSTYTGTHRNGGPSSSGSGVPKTGYKDLSELVQRDHVQDDAFHRLRSRPCKAAEVNSSAWGHSSSVSLPVLLGRPRPEPVKQEKDSDGKKEAKGDRLGEKISSLIGTRFIPVAAVSLDISSDTSSIITVLEANEEDAMIL
mmetsp:Transcript_102425/g.181904  ORF Transcript_102425/g.181904 Transcript_102425/m.181904 type:complete len:419 (+) Transcript_102425:78-1334(+)|eukprot:CAMPEP_0197650342 /NCGR_PEP_ID=MMETSP1338-20131121/30885_1 /TAXON_ID=43686 ORGANISM="Pelagodinium beii, Strain RCC1491" /NCGR_SAMPLE_ID=MMETSP1338 /ASSEMBLY_ACC=CAM_ASM_000754 /LENGTH=418 /DNA_ID=CAMNT_0043224729 /DNA_START=59 /DNA_END=1315 /DNA_ORIENTATION=+